MSEWLSAVAAWLLLLALCPKPVTPGAERAPAPAKPLIASTTAFSACSGSRAKSSSRSVQASALPAKLCTRELLARELPVPLAVPSATCSLVVLKRVPLKVLLSAVRRVPTAPRTTAIEVVDQQWQEQQQAARHQEQECLTHPEQEGPQGNLKLWQMAPPQHVTGRNVQQPHAVAVHLPSVRKEATTMLQSCQQKAWQAVDI